MRNEKSLPKYLIHEKFKMSTFFIKMSKTCLSTMSKTAPKWTNFSTFYLIFKGSPFQYYKVKHPYFL